MNRRQALAHLPPFIASSPVLRGDRRFSELADPIHGATNVFDMAVLAKKKIDISGKLFGKPFDHPFFFCPTGGKNCIMPNGELAVARAAAATNTTMITSGGVDSLLDSGKGPKNWWQFTTAAEFRIKNQMVSYVERV